MLHLPQARYFIAVGSIFLDECRAPVGHPRRANAVAMQAHTGTRFRLTIRALLFVESRVSVSLIDLSLVHRDEDDPVVDHFTAARGRSAVENIAARVGTSAFGPGRSVPACSRSQQFRRAPRPRPEPHRATPGPRPPR